MCNPYTIYSIWATSDHCNGSPSASKNRAENTSWKKTSQKASFAGLWGPSATKGTPQEHPKVSPMARRGTFFWHSGSEGAPCKPKEAPRGTKGRQKPEKCSIFEPCLHVQTLFGINFQPRCWIRLSQMQGPTCKIVIGELKLVAAYKSNIWAGTTLLFGTQTQRITWFLPKDLHIQYKVQVRSFWA